MSPLLFSLFINELGPRLNNLGFGIDLGSYNIGGILFADDLVLIGKDKRSLTELLRRTRLFFRDHNLTLSSKKSKVMLVDNDNDKMTFIGSDGMDPISLESVSSFKYLGVPLDFSPSGIFKVTVTYVLWILLTVC